MDQATQIERPQAALRAKRILHFAFVAGPLIAGLDKFFEILVDWEIYLAPFIPETLGISPEAFMVAVGVVEITAAILVALKPRIGGYIVALWLWLIIINLLILGDFYDIALRDAIISTGAIALSQLSSAIPEQ